MAANKIKLSKYLSSLERGVHEVNSHRLNSLKYTPLTCKKIAEDLGVSASTISNLNVDSKYSLIRSVAEEIVEAYQYYFAVQRLDLLQHLFSEHSDEIEYYILTEYDAVGTIALVIEDLYDSSFMFD